MLLVQNPATEKARLLSTEKKPERTGRARQLPDGCTHTTGALPQWPELFRCKTGVLEKFSQFCLISKLGRFRKETGSCRSGGLAATGEEGKLREPQ